MDVKAYQESVRTTRDKVATWVNDPRTHSLFAADLENAERQRQEYRKKVRRILKEKKRDVTQLDCPWDKFRLHESISLTVNDYRVLLAIVHDGFTWHERDRRRYFCHKLRRQGTIVDLLFWDMIWYEPRYEPLIREALDVVTRDIQGRSDLQKPEQSPGGPGEASEPPAAKARQIIKLSQWRTGKCRNLIQDLMDDELREGVIIRPKRHGKNQPRELRRKLGQKDMKGVADAITAVEGKAHTFRLTIPRDEIEYESPRT